MSVNSVQKYWLIYPVNYLSYIKLRMRTTKNNPNRILKTD